MEREGKLKGRNVVVTAAGSGIGQATTWSLVSEGANVCGVDINAEGLEQTAAAVTGDGAFIACNADAISREGVETVVEATLRAFGAIDGLANIIGGGTRGGRLFVKKLLHEFSDDEWDDSITFNLTSAFRMTRAAMPHLIAAGRSSIVHVSSAASLFAIAKTAPYSAAKAGIIGLTQTMALDYAEYGVRVNCIAPGTTLTPLMRSVRTEDEIAKLATSIMLRRGAEPSEMASIISFLISDEASFITGGTIPAFGGLRAGI